MESLVDVGHCPHYRSPTAWTLARVNADSAELWLSPGNSAKEKSATAKSFWHVHCTDHQKQLQLTGNESAKHGFFYSATTLAFSFTSTVVGRVLLEWNSTALGHHHSTTAEFVCYIIYHFSWSILFIEDLLKYLLFCQGKKHVLENIWWRVYALKKYLLSGCYGTECQRKRQKTKEVIWANWCTSW